jgi:hypothetical protein
MIARSDRSPLNVYPKMDSIGTVTWVVLEPQGVLASLATPRGAIVC